MGWLQTDQALQQHSYYATTAPALRRFAPLQGEQRADVAIVGGGLAGLSAAIELRQRGFDVALLEAREIASGASGRNGGQAIHGIASGQAEIESQLGLADARRVWDMSIEALDLIRERIARFGIACDARDGWLGVAETERKARALREECDTLRERYGYPLTWIPQSELPAWIASPRYAAGLHDARSLHLHPLKYARGLAAAADDLGVRLHELSEATSLEHGSEALLRTANGSLRATQVLLAGNCHLAAVTRGVAPQIAPRIMPAGTYIATTEALDPALAASLVPCGAAVCDNNFILDYYRVTPDHRVLYGGGVSYSGATPARMAEDLRRGMLRSFPQLPGDLRMEYAWGGFVDISMSRAPDFGRLGSARNVYYLQGFSGHGLALTGLAGRLVAEAMAGDASRFDVFARLKNRPFPGGRWLRMPTLVLGMAWYRLRDALG